MIDIVVCINDNYCEYCGVFLISLYENNKSESFTVHVLVDRISVNNKKNLEMIAAKFSSKIIFYEINTLDIENLPVSSQWPLVIYYRLLLPNIIDKKIDKLIYFDCDTLIRGSIKELWDFPIDNYALAAVEDVLSPIAGMIEQLGYDSKYRYFNSGVLLINLEYWRDHDISNKCIKFLNENSALVFHPDQDALNAVLFDKWQHLPYKFNFLTSYQKLYFKKEQMQYDFERKGNNYPIVVHFTGTKPWSSKCRSIFKLEYHEYSKCSPWKSKLKKHSVGELVIHLAIVFLDKINLRKNKFYYKY